MIHVVSCYSIIQFNNTIWKKLKDAKFAIDKQFHSNKTIEWKIWHTYHVPAYATEWGNQYDQWSAIKLQLHRIAMRILQFEIVHNLLKRWNDIPYWFIANIQIILCANLTKFVPSLSYRGPFEQLQEYFLEVRKAKLKEHRIHVCNTYSICNWIWCHL